MAVLIKNQTPNFITEHEFGIDAIRIASKGSAFTGKHADLAIRGYFYDR